MKTPRALLAVPLVLSSCLNGPTPGLEHLPRPIPGPESTQDLLWPEEQIVPDEQEACDTGAMTAAVGESRPIVEGEIMQSYVKWLVEGIACNANEVLAAEDECCPEVDKRLIVSTAFIGEVFNGALSSVVNSCGAEMTADGRSPWFSAADVIEHGVVLQGGQFGCLVDFAVEFDNACKVRAFDCEFSLGHDSEEQQLMFSMEYAPEGLGQELGDYPCVSSE